ncbi:MAG: DUF1573 domain-containing protein [Deltaproteobacteria bacterium]|nr:DUF1573 domain-containing protein [Deltaproteobacteria bacterium]
MERFFKMKNYSMNLKIYFLFGAGMLMLLLAAGALPAYTAPAPYVAEKIFNFGTILEGTEVPHDFILENHGNSTLKVLKVKSNCACAVASFTEEIPPGSKGKVSVVFDSRGSGGINVEHKIRVETDCPDNSEIDLAITGHVDPVLIIKPEVVILSGMEGEVLETEILITHDKRHPVKVLSAESKRGFISALLTAENGSDQNSYRVQVASLKMEKGKFQDYLSLQTDSSLYPVKQVRVRIEIK